MNVNPYPSYPPPPPPPATAWYPPPQRNPSALTLWIRANRGGFDRTSAAPLAILLAGLAVGLVTDLMWHPGPRGIGITCIGLALTAAIALVTRPKPWESRAWLGACVVLAAICSVRASAWVEGSCGAAAGVCLIVAAFTNRHGTAFDRSWTRVLSAWGTLAFQGLFSISWIGRGTRQRLPATRPLGTGIALALILVLVLGGR